MCKKWVGDTGNGPQKETRGKNKNKENLNQTTVIVKVFFSYFVTSIKSFQHNQNCLILF